MVKCRLALLSCSLFFLIEPAWTQEVQTDPNGDKIVVFEDGSWRYYEAGDSTLAVSSTLPQHKRTNDYRMFQRYIVAAVAYEAEQVKQLDDSKNAFHDLEDQIRMMTANDEKSDSLEWQLAKLKKQVQNDQRLLAYSRGLIKKILKAGAKERYDKLEEIYVPGLATIKLTDEQLDQTDQIIANRSPAKLNLFPLKKNGSDQAATKKQHKSDRNKKGRKREKEDLAEKESFEEKKRQSTPSEEINSGAGESVNPDEDDREVADTPQDDENRMAYQEPDVKVSPADEIQSTNPSLGADQSTPPPPQEGSNDPQVSQPDLSTTSKEESAVLAYGPIAGYDWDSEVLVDPPKYHCHFTYEGVDAFTQQQKRELAGEYFFSHTDDRLKPYLQNRDYVKCQSYLTSISGGYRYLTLVITIGSRNARREYGYIKSGSLLNIKLLDNKTVSLFSQGDHLGNINTANGTTTYTIKYPIDFQKEKILSKGEVDKVRIVWSTGYEDYEVYNVDFFINQLSCLNNN